MKRNNTHGVVGALVVVRVAGHAWR
jgi:hypothetical protein